tara:strand:+ start:1703 stop:2791 length:1089 start_codon:yes stop_codon:yes gene_type:complete
MKIMHDFKKIKSNILSQIENSTELDDLDMVRVSAIGRKGQITELMKTLRDLEPNERKDIGQQLNLLKKSISDAINIKRKLLEEKNINLQLSSETIDLTLPVENSELGFIHPISQVIDEIIIIFGQMGFVVAEGPDIEDDWHNFTALNIPEEHPARQMHDTFYLGKKKNSENLHLNKVLRTHTSPVQVRTMLTQSPSIKIIVPGRTYRSDSDQTHTPMFHQVEGLVIDESTNMGHLKGCLVNFVSSFFGLKNLDYRFRPSYFPFTEPSAEMDIGCVRKKNEIQIGGAEDWLEILGCGMVNPRVLENCGIDSKKYQGFAFGMGIDRLAMLKYGMPDLRSFFDSDLRWLRHYGFMPIDSPGMPGR